MTGARNVRGAAVVDVINGDRNGLVGASKKAVAALQESRRLKRIFIVTWRLACPNNDVTSPAGA